MLQSAVHLSVCFRMYSTCQYQQYAQPNAPYRVNLVYPPKGRVSYSRRVLKGISLIL